jgi:hypothetical protein
MPVNGREPLTLGFLRLNRRVSPLLDQNVRTLWRVRDAVAAPFSLDKDGLGPLDIIAFQPIKNPVSIKPNSEL